MRTPEQEADECALLLAEIDALWTYIDAKAEEPIEKYYKAALRLKRLREKRDER